ncbi:hypothetical protein V2G26_006367 [Clonostachys chloroleuca]
MQTELRIDPGITSPKRRHEDDRLIALILEGVKMTWLYILGGYYLWGEGKRRLWVRSNIGKFRDLLGVGRGLR